MHEMSITRSILKAAKREMDKAGLKRLESVKVRIGELTAVEPEALRFSFAASTKRPPFKGAKLYIEEAPLKGRCLDCQNEFRIEAFRISCPACGGSRVERTGGTELEIVSIEAD